MPICMDEALAAKAEMPCADHHGAKKEGKSNKLTFMSDCTGVDMHKADTASLDKPDLKSDSVVYVLADNARFDWLLHKSPRFIRGPPPDWPALSQTHTPILLTTQRLRI